MGTCIPRNSSSKQHIYQYYQSWLRISRNRSPSIELSGSLTKVLSDSVDKVFNFLLERNNPYEVKETTKLHHFTTGHIVFDEHAKRLLSFFDHGQANYIEFRKER